ncbi:unnamed protein product [Linum trigynum]|uniref:Cleavage/polyadenylation specificity factor A subunit N-terminal domain-containing protein n=1 Tax=Linum trigynum TaxID=586398 RepID=A0AAV2D0B0_9ROSI
MLTHSTTDIANDLSSYFPRLICVCSSSGTIHLLQVKMDDVEKPQKGSRVHEFARLDLPGDIFSSPVMIGGRIFVGCRDDYVHCIAIDAESLAGECDDDDDDDDDDE